MSKTIESSDSKQQDLIAGCNLVYRHPALNMDMLRFVCDGIDNGIDSLSNDELSEILEVMSLSIDQDSAFQNWLAVQPSLPSAYRNTHSAEAAQSLEALAKQVWLGNLDNCQLDTESSYPNALVKLLCFLDIPRSSNDLSVTIIENEDWQYRFLAANLTPHHAQPHKTIICQIAIDDTWKERECLYLRSDLFRVPCIVLGVLRPSSLSDNPKQTATTTSIEPYVILTLPETYRTGNLILTERLEDIQSASKQFWEEEQSIELLSRRNSESLDIEHVQRNYALLADTVNRCVSSQDLSELAQNLLHLFYNKPSVSLGRPQALSKLLSTINLETHSPDSINAATLILHLCFRLSMIPEASCLSEASVALCLSRRSLADGTNYLPDEGEFVSVEITHPGLGVVQIHNGLEKSSVENVVSSIPVSLYCPILENANKAVNRIYKAQPTINHLPNIGGVKWGNLLSPIAIVSVGSVQHNLTYNLLHNANVIVELEDRPTRTANLPDPWPYNLSKTMKAITGNPNIRYLIIVGETDFCADTTSMLQSKKTIDAIQEDVHTFIPAGLVQTFQKQILQAFSLDGNFQADQLVQIHLQKILRESLQEKGDLTDINCFPHGTTKRNPTTNHNYVRKDLTDAIEYYVQKFNEGEQEKADEAALVAQTAKRAQPGLISIVLKYGELKGPDSLGRYYKDLMSYRVIINDIINDRVLSGITNKQAENFVQKEWLRPGGLFFTRLTKSFGVNQIESCISRIVKTIENGTVSRSVIMSVSHPRIDHKRTLGVNTIHFSFRQLSEKKYQLVGAIEWRTVESLYALAYSIYTTCRFQQYITDECKQRINKDYEIVYGEAIHLALNQHVYLDELNYDIALRIIEDALDKR